MSRLNGYVDFIGPSGGFTAEGGSYTGTVQGGITFSAPSGGLSGLAGNHIIFDSEGSISGVAQTFLNLGSRGSHVLIDAENGDLYLDAQDDWSADAGGSMNLVGDDGVSISATNTNQNILNQFMAWRR